MKNNKTHYLLDLKDFDDVDRIKTLLDLHIKLLSILNKDSDNSIEGGAYAHYKVKIDFEEEWI